MGRTPQARWLVASVALAACGQFVDADAGNQAPSTALPGPFCQVPCSSDEQCENGMVCAHTGCTKPCLSSAECGPAPEWRCEPGLLSDAGQLCLCQSTGSELCDGRDNDCNGTVDDGASCAEDGEICVDGACQCPSEHRCGDACSDLSLDSRNCGGCGKACPVAIHARALCGAGQCELICDPGFSNCDDDYANGCEATGTCTPFVLAMATDVQQISVDETDVYWVDRVGVAQQVFRVQKQGGTATPVPGTDGATAIAMHGRFLYWVAQGTVSPAQELFVDGQVLRSDKDNGPPQVLSSGAQLPTWIAASDDAVFFAELGTLYGCWSHSWGRIRSVGFDGSPGPLPFEPNFVEQPESLTVTGPFIYWTDASPLLPASPLRRAATGCPIPADLDVDAFVVTADESGLYAIVESSPSDSVLERIALGGGVRRELFRGTLMPTIASDRSSVYVVERTGSSEAEFRLLRIPKRGGMPAVITEGSVTPRMAVDDRWVYVALNVPDDGGQLLVRTPR